MKSFLIRSLFCLCLLAVSRQESVAQFTTVIDVPPDLPPSQIASDTQPNLEDGGTIANGFSAGNSSGTSTNVEINITGGTGCRISRPAAVRW